jgi:uncharacterized Zn finger protein (UPF0148 family)
LLQQNKSSPCVCISCDKQYTKTASGEVVSINDDKKNVKQINSNSNSNVNSNNVNNNNANNNNANSNVNIDEYIKDTDEIKATLGPLIDISSAPILNFSQQDKDPSSLIAKKMLQGYTLIDSICSNASCSGSIPLLRDKDGLLFCVSCDDVKEQSARSKKASTVMVDDSSFDDADDEVAYSEYMKARLTSMQTDPIKAIPSSSVSGLVGSRSQQPTASVDSSVHVIKGTDVATKGLGLHQYRHVVTALETKLETAVQSLNAWYVCHATLFYHYHCHYHYHDHYLTISSSSSSSSSLS